MVMRVSVGRIVHGNGQTRTIIGPGDRFDTDLLGWDAAEVSRRERSGVIRRVRDSAVMAPAAVPGPRSAVEEPVEGRSGDVQGDARSPAAVAVDQPDADADASTRRSRRRPTEADDL